MEVAVAYAHVGDALHCGCLDRAAEYVHGPVADVVPDDHQDVGGIRRRLRLQVGFPIRHRIPDIEIDRALPSLGHLALSML